MTELGDLTPRQLVVASMVARGMCDKEIAKELGIAYSTVRVHLVALAFRLKLPVGLNTRVLVARWWYSKTPDIRRDPAA